MRCPVCGAKLYQKLICPYCKITAEEIMHASNKKVKECRKTGKKDLICFSTVLPQDVSRVKLWLFTIFLGWCGVNHFIIGRNIRGGFAVGATVMSLFMMLVKYVILTNVSLNFLLFIQALYEISMYAMIINLIMWISDIIALIFKGFKVPVVLPPKEKKKNG